GLLRHELLQVFSELLLHVVEAGVRDALTEEVSLDLPVAWVRDLGIDFLFDQLLRRRSEPPGFGLDDPETDQALESLALGFVLLVAQLHQLLGAERLPELVLGDGLTGNRGNGTPLCRGRRGLGRRGNENRKTGERAEKRPFC